MIKIDKNVPIFGKIGRSPGELLIALRSMEVGDSTFVNKRPSGFTLTASKPKTFTCRKCEGGFRVWRTA